MCGMMIFTGNSAPRRLIFRFLCCFCILASGCDAETATINFAQLQRANSPNDALACPLNLCAAPADFVTEPIDLAADALAARVAEILSQEVRTEFKVADSGNRQMIFVQRSRLFRFPDTINILIVPISEGRATVAIYSWSNYGHGDFGVNRARVMDWLTKLGIPHHAGT
jgi:uncharacterized protein (DUF1499 family)